MVVSALNIQVQRTDRSKIGHSSFVQIRACGLGWNSISPAFAWVMRQSKLTPITSKTPAFPQQTASENELIQWRAAVERCGATWLSRTNGRSFPLSIITRSAHLILIQRRGTAPQSMVNEIGSRHKEKCSLLAGPAYFNIIEYFYAFMPLRKFELKRLLLKVITKKETVHVILAVIISYFVGFIIYLNIIIM